MASCRDFCHEHHCGICGQAPEMRSAIPDPKDMAKQTSQPKVDGRQNVGQLFQIIAFKESCCPDLVEP